MNPIQQLFKQKQKNILSVFFIAGYPQLGDTSSIIKALSKNGADLIEVGMPYSDPVADGPVIEEADAIALQNGMTIKKLFEQLHQLDLPTEERIPLLLMGYLNPVMQYGFEKFCKDAAGSGVSGLIIPDLPPDIYKEQYQKFVEANSLQMVFLITPETGEERIKMIDSISTGFIYAVSSSSITGRDSDESKKEAYFKRLQAMKLHNPILVGFGIKNSQTFEQACRYTNGAITGTAFINSLKSEKDINKITGAFIRSFHNE